MRPKGKSTRKGIRYAFMAILAVVLAACATTAPPQPPPEEEGPGTLVVVVTGLPPALNADVAISGPAGFSETVTASETFTDLEPGSYSATATDVDDGGDIYAATISGSPAAVPADGTATITVEYTFLDPTLVGSLQVDIVGLPVGVDAAVNVSGPAVDQDLTVSTTIDDLTPANYTITAADVNDAGLVYAAEVDASPTLVLPEQTATATVTYRPFVPNDGDAASAPGLFAQFRSTSPAPVTVTGLLFNEATPIDTMGIQLVDSLGEPEDPGDWIAFELVHGESPTTSVNFALDCDTEFTPGSPIRLELRDEDGDKIGVTVTCDGANDIAIPNDGGSGDYLVHIIPSTTLPFYVAYTVSIDAFCFQGCTYQPFVP